MKKRTWILIGLIVVLGLVYQLTRKDRVSVGVMQLDLPAFASKDVDRIEISGKEQVKLKKMGDDWKVEVGDEKAPRLLAADRSNAEGVIEAAASIRSAHYVTKMPEKLSELGLDDQASTTVKLFSQDKMLWALRLGREADGSGRYAKGIDDANVYVVKGPLWQLARNGAGDFRDKKIIKVDEPDLVSFSLKRDGKIYLALKRPADSENWAIDESQMALPKSFRVNPRVLSSLVRSSTNLVAQGFVDEPKELSGPQLTVEMTSKDGKINGIDFFAKKDKEGYLAKKSGDEQIFEVAKYNVDRLNKDISDYRDLSVMKLDKGSITSLLLNGEKGEVKLRKQEDKWQIEMPKKLPEGFEFDESRIEGILSNIADLNAVRIAAKGRDLPKNANWLKAAAATMMDDKGLTIDLFATKTKGGQDEYLAKGNIDDEIYVVKGQDLDFLRSGLDAFKKQDFELPPIDENTKGLESLPPDVRRKLLEMSKGKKK